MGRPEDPAELYLELLRRCLTRSAFPERWRPYRPRGVVRRALVGLATAFASRPLAVVRVQQHDARLRSLGLDRPPEAETMIGEVRLAHLQGLVKDVVVDDVPGDLLETGVWRGGALVLMRAALEVYGDRTRTVWGADSFRGLPPPDPARYPADEGIRLHEHAALAVSLDEVRANLTRYGWLDERVRFLEGWFADTLPTAPVERLAILRLDGDLYMSTRQALVALYRKVSIGGHVVVDDYGAVPACKQAIEEWRTEQGVTEPIQPIDGSGVFWTRER